MRSSSIRSRPISITRPREPVAAARRGVFRVGSSTTASSSFASTRPSAGPPGIPAASRSSPVTASSPRVSGLPHSAATSSSKRSRRRARPPQAAGTPRPRRSQRRSSSRSGAASRPTRARKRRAPCPVGSRLLVVRVLAHEVDDRETRVVVVGQPAHRAIRETGALLRRG